MIKKEYLGSKFTLRGIWSGVIKDDEKSIKLYKKLGLPIFEEVKPAKKNATKEKPSK